MITGFKYCQVAVKCPLNQLFSYRIPPQFQSQTTVGTRVLVPFQRRQLTGMVTGFTDQAPPGIKLRSIIKPLEEIPAFDRSLLRLAEWIAGYYLCPLGVVIDAMLPNIKAKEKQQLFFQPLYPRKEINELAEQRVKKAPRQAEILRFLAGGPGSRNDLAHIPLTVFGKLEQEGLIERYRERLFRNPFRMEIFPEPSPEKLFPEQQKILDIIASCIKNSRFQAFLLHGVTGSGKTEIYLKAAREALSAGGQVLILVPEIALTPQLYNRFQARFQGRTALLHSALSQGERLDEWNRVRSGDAAVVVGTRSALFAPLDNLKLIVVDEEHDPSFKQENQPCYSGRDGAVLRAQQAGCPVVLGSATPSLESYYNTETGKYRLLELPERIYQRPMPEVKLVDMRVAACLDGNRTVSSALTEALESNLQKGEHSILLLNRRGFHNFILCPDCGKSVECPHCSVSLTYHKVGDRLLCHYCGYGSGFPQQCGDCRCVNLRSHGSGTQQLGEIIRERFPEARILRMDRDSSQSKSAYWEMYRKLKNNEVDILIGTQIIAKGLDLPGVTLVGVVAADNSLYQPDFRAAERTFALLTQVAGRAGRGENPGRVYIQTFNPDHYSIQAAAGHDYQRFYKEETRYRKALGYPPFERLINIKIKDENPDKGFCRAREIAREMKELSEGDYQVIGPAQAPLAQIAGKYRWQVLLKGSNRQLMRQDLKKAQVDSSQVAVDIDPLNLL
ncbi:MAG: primosomal protein N' [bacterium]